MNKLFALTFGISSMIATSAMATPNGNPNGTPPPFQENGGGSVENAVDIENNPTFVGVDVNKNHINNRDSFRGTNRNSNTFKPTNKNYNSDFNLVNTDSESSAFAGAANLTKSQLESILNSANSSESSPITTNAIEQSGQSSGNTTQFSSDDDTLVLPDSVQFSDTEFNVTPGIDGLGCGKYRPSIDYGGSNSTKVGAWIFGYERTEVADDVPDAVIDRHFTALVKGSGLCSGAYMLQNYVDPSPHVPVETKQNLYEDFTNSLEQYFKDLSPAVVK